MIVSIGLPDSRSQGSYAPSWKKLFQIKHLYICVIPSVILSPNCKCAHYFNATRDDKINDCSFKFSVACFNRRRQG